MEDYIFLILAILLSIFAAITKKNKKGNEGQLVKKAEKPRNFFMDQLLGEDFLEEEEDEVKPVMRSVVKKETVPGVPQVSSLAQYHPEFKSSLPDRPQRNALLSVKKADILPDDVETENGEVPGYLEDFSLRKAFVYSEIMTTKY